MHTSPSEAPVVDDVVVAPSEGTLRALLNAYGKKVVETTLNKNRWHRSHVARLLGSDRKTLFTKMKRHGLLPYPGY